MSTTPQHVDVLVLGAGPGGYVAAIRAAQLGKSVAIVEEKYWGGVCLNVGCIPSKALLRNAELAHIFTSERSTFGISGEVTFDYGAAYDRSRKVADGRAKGVRYLMKKNKITEYEGRGTFTDPHTIEVTGADGSTGTVTFEHAIIATGARARLIPGTSLSDRVVTYEEQILSADLPSSIIIAGAGAIGVEFAYVLHNYGVQVTIVEYLDRMVPLEDKAVSAELLKRYKRLGVEVLTGARVDAIVDDGDGVDVTFTRGGATETRRAERVLQAIGFAPNVTGYGLDATGVELTERGAIEVDRRGRTSVPHIYAIGDVTAQLMLAHAAEAMGVVAAETIAGAETMELDFAMIPRATFCQPQIASFGFTEEQAVELDYAIKVAQFPFTANGKAHGIGDTAGFVKLISDRDTGELLGGHLIGPDVTELLPELTLAQRFELRDIDLARNVHAHPTLGEALQEAIHGLAGHMINL
ncbi:MAG TPA: dihydrolipoyl dehydrogenase [Micromonosporaceae bacterium]